MAAANERNQLVCMNHRSFPVLEGTKTELGTGVLLALRSLLTGLLPYRS